MGESAIAVHGLRKRFGDKEAVAGIDLAAAAGSFAGLVGPNGAEMQALDGRRPLRAWFSGQNIAVAMVAVPLLAAVSFGLAAVARHPLDGFLGLAVDLAGIGAGLALGDVFTVTWPYPMVKKPGNPTRGCPSWWRRPGGTASFWPGPGL